MPNTVAAAGNVLPSPQEPRQYRTFSLAGEMFGVGALTMREIIEYGRVTTLPMMPAFVRGAVVPVIDCRGKGRPGVGRADPPCCDRHGAPRGC